MIDCFFYKLSLAFTKTSKMIQNSSLILDTLTYYHDDNRSKCIRIYSILIPIQIQTAYPFEPSMMMTMMPICSPFACSIINPDQSPFFVYAITKKELHVCCLDAIALTKQQTKKGYKPIDQTDRPRCAE